MPIPTGQVTKETKVYILIDTSYSFTLLKKNGRFFIIIMAVGNKHIFTKAQLNLI